MLGGAPEAYEVSSKTPRVEFQSFAKFLPEAFPIKANDHKASLLSVRLIRWKGLGTRKDWSN